MAPITTCDGDVYLHNLSTFIKSHERQLANALLAYKKQTKSSKQQQQLQQLNSKPVRLSLTLHHLYYLLERFQDLGISVGPMNIRLDNIHNDDTSLNYVSFLSDFHNNKRMSSDAQSIHSMTSVKSVMSSVSALWTSMGSGSGVNSRDVLISDLKYLYSAFTKLPCLRLAPDSRAKLIEGHEEYPFDTAVPLKAFKNLSVLEVCDLNLKEIYGWNLISEQIKFLVLKKMGITDPVEVLIDLVEEDYQYRGYQHEDNISDSNSNIGSMVSPPKHSSSFSISSGSTPITSINGPTSDFHHQHYYTKKTNYNKHHPHLSMSSSYTPSAYQLSGSLPDSHFHGAGHQRVSPTLTHATLTRQYTNEEITRPRKNTNNSSTSSLSTPIISNNIASTTATATVASSVTHYRRPNTLYLQQQSTSPPPSNTALAAATRRVKRSKSNASDYSIPLRSTPTPPPQQQQQQSSSTGNKWKHLKHLSFTENNIITISDWSFQPLQSLSSLDLSHNKLTEIPSALSHLKNLKSLNLSYNKLQSTSGFNRNELTKLSILNLKSNKLNDLTSLEFLKNLDKLDLRSNKLNINSLKPLLMGTKPLKLKLLFLQNNDMKNYRIELFNLFNGIDYENSLKIDGSRPGMFESRLLLDSKNSELKLNKFFISQITNSISTMSLSQTPPPPPPSSSDIINKKTISMTTSTTANLNLMMNKPQSNSTTTTTTTNITLPKPTPKEEEAASVATVEEEISSPSQVAPLPLYSDKDYVLLPPLKPFLRPTLETNKSEDTLKSSASLINNNSSNSTNTATIVHSPSLILKTNHESKDASRPSSLNFDFIRNSPMSTTNANTFTKTLTPTSPHSTYPTGGSLDSPRTVSSSHTLASKLNRLSNDLSTIVSTTNSNHDLLTHKLGPPLPPITTVATSTVNNSGNSNPSSQRTSIISTQITTTSNSNNNNNNNNKENDLNFEDDFGSNINNNDHMIKPNSAINPAIVYLLNND